MITSSLMRWAALVVGVSLATPALGQSDRHELGRRLRAFEVAWDRADPSARARSSGALDRAVKGFFALQLGEAGRAIADAHAALAPRTPAQAWAESIAVDLERRWVDPSAPTLGATARAFYPAARPIPVARLRASSGGAGPVEVALDAFPARIDCGAALRGLEPGDRALEFAVLDADDRVLARIAEPIAVIGRFADRFAALDGAVGGWADASTLDRASARNLRDVLRSALAGRTFETDLPLAALLDEAEAIVRADVQHARFHGPDRPGQHWLALPTGPGRLTYARALVPETTGPDDRRPLVVALHGAGGSENMFFDAYGAGAIVKACRSRGWALVAPRSTLGGAPVVEVVGAMARAYPIDTTKVFVVGHSMGAAQAIGAAARDPRRFAAVAALGGGGAVGPSEAIRTLPVFVGVGLDDFALGGARKLRDALRAAGVADLAYREVPGVEHLAIVPALLPEVFTFFDARIQP